MTLDDRLSSAARHVADGLVPPVVDLDSVRFQARRNNRRTAALSVAAAVVAVVGISFTIAGAQDTSGPDPVPPMPTPSETRVPDEVGIGALYVAADAGAGEALTDPVNYGRVETAPKPMDIYLRRPGQPAQRVISTDAHERCPAVSPDGRRLLYLEGATVVVVPLDGEGIAGKPELEVKLPRAQEYAPRLHFGPTCPQWSPDGSGIAYVKQSGGQTGELYVSDLKGEERLLSSEGSGSCTPFPCGALVQPYGFAWSPDGDTVAYTSYEGVWRAAVDGSGADLVWQVPETDPPSGVGGFDNDRPIALSWSVRDELAVTIRSFTALDESSTREDHTLYVLNVDSGRREEVGGIAEYDTGAVWSPDGSRLVFVGADWLIRVHDRSSGSTSKLTPALPDDREYHLWDVTWSADAQRLVGLAWAEGEGMALVSVPLDGSSAEPITPWTWGFDWINLEDMSQISQ